MTLSIVVLTPDEKFIRFLDPDLCSISESCVTNGLRTISFEYKFQDMKKDQELFKLGNKIWIQGDNNLTDCLYLINTNVKQDIFKDNSFTFDCEEVLVELTYAPLHSHLDVTATNGFSLATQNGVESVKIDYNALHFWFGDYFNIGVVQDCLSAHAQYISLTGTITPMALLRKIEEETGNVFITRYEKDVLNNTIHRYLDFLNPINTSKDWTLNLEYRFVNTTNVVAIYNSNNQVADDDLPQHVTPFRSNIPDESLEESVAINDNDDGEDMYQGYSEVEYEETWIASEQEVEDQELQKEYVPIGNLNPSHCYLRITDGENLLNSDGAIYEDDGDVPLQWTNTDAGFTNNTQTVVLSLIKTGNKLGIDCNDKSFLVAPDEDVHTDYNLSFVEAIQNEELNPSYIEEESTRIDVVIPDDSYFEIYDYVNNKVLFRTCINRAIGTVHEEILDLGFNLENVVHDINETDTYTSVAPVLSLSESNDTSNSLTRTQLGYLMNHWKKLKINKGDVIPMIVQKVNITAPSLESAKIQLESYDELSGANQSKDYSNWWKRPYNPQDQKNDTDSSQNTWEFLRGISYWRAPYDKAPGQFDIETDKSYATQFRDVYQRADTRDEKGMIKTPKQGTTTSTDEDVFQIYNQVALYLKEHEEPNIDLELDVANLRNGNYNQYQIWDKVYVKIPDTDELITARVVEVKKEAHDVAKNTVKLSNYKTKTVKTLTKATVIHTSNISYKYPTSKKVTVQLENIDYTKGDILYPTNKLLNFTLYKVDSGSATFIKNYTKITDVYGRASLNTKLSPGDYKMEVSFGGDEEFAETTSTLKINVSGKKKTATKKSKSKSKTTKESSKTTSKVEYYDKYGRSPDKKKILAIGRISASGDRGSYANFFGMEFENRCPKCGRKGTLFWDIFWAGNEHSNWGRVRKTGNREGGSAEGHIFCENQKCDGDWSCQGHEHGYTNTNLKAVGKRFKSSKADAYKLRKGKYVYTAGDDNNSKNITNNKNRKIVGKIAKSIKNLAWNIVGNKTGYAALREICSYMDNKISYAKYVNFRRTPVTVVKKKGGNCCDQTRLFLQLCDAAGLTEFYKLYYIHVTCPQYGHVYAMVESKKTGKKVYIDPASDTYNCYGYVCDSCPHGGKSTRYPKKPF